MVKRSRDGPDASVAVALKDAEEKAEIFQFWMRAGETLVGAAQKVFVAMKYKRKEANGRRTSVGALGGNDVQITLNDVHMPPVRLEPRLFQRFTEEVLPEVVSR
eukprot:1623301-Prymnesium_polylepis.1